MESIIITNIFIFIFSTITYLIKLAMLSFMHEKRVQ